MTHTRQQIRTVVEANVGVHFNELVRLSGFAPGQVQYHLRQLIDDGRIVRREFYGQTHYYPPECGEWERAALALFRRETARAIVVSLIEREPTDPGTVAASIDVARGTVEYHLDRLVEHGVVEKRYDDHNRVQLRLARPERTARALSAVEPTVPDRLLDRFTRLVDGILEGDGG